MSTMQKSTASGKSNKYGVKFSDEEDNNKSDDQEYVPLREEDF